MGGVYFSAPEANLSESIGASTSSRKNVAQAEKEFRPSLFNVVKEPLLAVSLTSDPDNLPTRVDIPALWRPMRAFFYCTLLPPLAPVLFALNGWAVGRCLFTGRLPPASTNIPKYEDRHIPEIVCYKRTYDVTRKKVLETVCTMDNESEDMKRALQVVGKKRGEYVDDGMGNSYFVMERQLINKGYLYRRERWIYSALSDFIRYGCTLATCYIFLPSARRFNADIIAYLSGKLPRHSIRHPVTNFFMSVTDYNKAKHRIQARGSLVNVVSAKPWTPLR